MLGASLLWAHRLRLLACRALLPRSGCYRAPAPRGGWLAGIVGRAVLGVGLLSASTGAAVPIAYPSVVSSWPHDPEAFTQGLLIHCGVFYESTGLYEESSLRLVDIHSGDVLRQVALPAEEFGEGLSLVDERLIQLTWKNGVAHEYQEDTFASTREFEYEGEGWGLCYDGNRLVMSDGSSELFFRDPETFELLGQVKVTLDGDPVVRLNELECVGELVYANVWMTDSILRIDPASGEVLTLVDASGLLSDEEARAADVLNGIAYHPTSQHFFIGGKLWPRLFEVRFPFDPEAASAADIDEDTDPDAGRLVGSPDAAVLDPDDCERALVTRERAEEPLAPEDAGGTPVGAPSDEQVPSVQDTEGSDGVPPGGEDAQATDSTSAGDSAAVSDGPSGDGDATGPNAGGGCGCSVVGRADTSPSRHSSEIGMLRHFVVIPWGLVIGLAFRRRGTFPREVR